MTPTSTLSGALGGADFLLQPRFTLKKVAALVAFAMSVYHLWTGYTGEPVAEVHRPVHLLFALSILFLDSKREAATALGRALKLTWDSVMIALLIASTAYLFLNVDYVSTRLAFITPLSELEYFLSIALLFVLLEAARRTVGWALVILTVVFILYAMYGNHLPAPFWHRGFSLDRVMDMLYFTSEGLWGTPIGVTASFIFHFVLFGALLVASGAGSFFTDAANAITGRFIGGPAKTAVVASGMMASLSGSAAANVVTTGSFTIPAMRRAGYRPEFAAGVEACASAGGLLTPPVMGAAAFVMAEFTGISYFAIMVAAIIPAVLYYLAIFIQVDLEARKAGLKAVDAGLVPRLWDTLKRRGYLVLPLAALVYFLMEGYTPVRGAIWAIISLVVLLVVLDSQNRRRILHVLWEALTAAPRMMGPITVAVSIGGILVGIITMTGIGIRLSSVILNLAQGQLFVILLLTMLFSIILGMGMPVTGAYIILAVLLAPAMVQLGVPLLAAHMFIFYGGCKSNITPPVAIASYAAAAVANTNPWTTSLVAFRIGLSIFIIPFMFVYSPELLGMGDAMAITWRTIMAALGIAAISTCFAGWFLVPLNPLERLIVFGIACVFIFPGTTTDLSALVLLTLFCGYCLFNRSRTRLRLPGT
jgi:TRAP transporter 4TM/12TM fusion protein